MRALPLARLASRALLRCSRALVQVVPVHGAPAPTPGASGLGLTDDGDYGAASRASVRSQSMASSRDRRADHLASSANAPGDAGGAPSSFLAGALSPGASPSGAQEEGPDRSEALEFDFVPATPPSKRFRSIFDDADDGGDWRRRRRAAAIAMTQHDVMRSRRSNHVPLPPPPAARRPPRPRPILAVCGGAAQRVLRATDSTPPPTPTPTPGPEPSTEPSRAEPSRLRFLSLSPPPFQRSRRRPRVRASRRGGKRGSRASGLRALGSREGISRAHESASPALA